MSNVIRPPMELFRQDAKGNRELDPTALKRLRDVAVGRSSAFSRAHALAMLVDSGFAGASQDLSQILANESEAPELRRRAAIFLGQANEALAERALIANSHTRDEHVLAGVARALGYQGGMSALESVLEIEARTQGFVQRQAAFSARLISCRLMAEGVLPPVEPTTLIHPAATDVHAIEVSDAPSDQVAACVDALTIEPYGITYATDQVLQLQCADVTWMLLLNRDYVQADGAVRLSQRLAFPAVLARRNHANGRFRLSRLVLTGPGRSAGTVDVQVYRPSGDLVLAGTAQVKGREADLVLGAVARPGAPGVSVSGRFAEGRFSGLTGSSGRTAIMTRGEPIQSH